MTYDAGRGVVHDADASVESRFGGGDQLMGWTLPTDRKP
jgi:hypothetical protein